MKAITIQPRLRDLAWVKEATGQTKLQIYRLMADGKFPRQVKTSANTVRWVESEVMSWIQDRISERDCVIDSRANDPNVVPDHDGASDELARSGVGYDQLQKGECS